MSDLAPSYRPSATRSAIAALALAVGSVVTWFLAPSADELWPVAALVGAAAFGMGWKARRNARRAGTSGLLALVAMITGGLVATQVIVFTIGWGIYHLIS